MSARTTNTSGPGDPGEAVPPITGKSTVARLLIIAALWFGLIEVQLDRRLAGETARSEPPAAVLQQLVSSGEAAPVGGSFDRFEIDGRAIAAPSTAKGDVAFFASLVRSRAEEGLFIATGDHIGKIAAVGDTIPSGEHIADFTDRPGVALNKAGTIAFVAGLAGGRATGGLLIVANGKLEPVALSGAAAPEIAGGSLASFEGPALNDAGEVAFLASVRRSRGSAGDAILLHRGGEPRKLVAAGDDAPGGGIFSGLGAPAMNNRGVVAFPAVVEQGPVLGGLYVVENGQARLVLPAGSPAPNGGVFAKFSEQVAINDAGAIAFSAVVRHGGPAAAVFVLEGDTAQTVAATGEPAPDGGSFAAFPSWPVLGQSGTIAFVAAIDDGSSPLAAYISGATGLRRLAGIGDALPAGGRLASFPRYPAVAIGPDDAVTFAATSESEGKRTDKLFYYGPPRNGDR